jgi:uncharacterized coiled-coil protein SlyX
MKCPGCGGFQGTNTWTCTCYDPIEPATLARLEPIENRLRSVEHRWNDQRKAIVDELADMVGEVLGQVRERQLILEARIADLEAKRLSDQAEIEQLRKQLTQSRLVS